MISNPSRRSSRALWMQAHIPYTTGCQRKTMLISSAAQRLSSTRGQQMLSGAMSHRSFTTAVHRHRPQPQRISLTVTPAMWSLRVRHLTSAAIRRPRPDSRTATTSCRSLPPRISRSQRLSLRMCLCRITPANMTEKHTQSA